MPTKRDLETNDASVLLKRIKKEFPGIEWENHTFLNHGWDHEVIILDKKIVFRFPNSSEYANSFKEEVKLLQFLVKKLSVNIPDYKYVAKDHSFAGYDIVPGIELSEKAFTQLRQSEKSEIAKQLAGFLAALHSLPSKELAAFEIEPADIPSETKRMRRQAQQYLSGKLTKVEYHRVVEILDKLDALPFDEMPRSLIHNDLSPSHIFWDSGSQRLGVIDFSDRSLGDPAFDFTELLDYGDSFTQEVFSQYDGPKDSDFLERSKLYWQRVGVYLLIDSFLTNKISFDRAKAIFDRANST